MERPTILQGVTFKTPAACQRLYTTVNSTEDRGLPIEVFCTMGKAGGCASALLECVGRLISIGLQHGVPIDAIVKQLTGHNCHESNGSVDKKTCVHNVGLAIQKYRDEIMEQGEDSD